jgi:hypothetical protein
MAESGTIRPALFKTRSSGLIGPDSGRPATPPVALLPGESQRSRGGLARHVHLHLFGAAVRWQRRVAGLEL